jgi:hypothetical protein
MARLRKPDPTPDPIETAADPIAPEERLDRRMVLIAPEHLASDPEALLAWATKHHAAAVKSNREVVADRRTLADARRRSSR